MTHSANHIMEKLRLLQHLDSVIDFSRATLQIEIVFALVFSPRPLTPTDLAIIINERRKAVLDALRKLEIKGIVKRKGSRRGEALYVLGDRGHRYAEGLKALLGMDETRVTQPLGVTQRIQVQRSLIEAYYAYKALVSLALAPGSMLSLKELAKVLELSPDRARSYLDLFSRPPSRLFRKILPPTGGTYYRLEDGGLRLFYRTPHARLARSRIYRFLARLLNEYWPERIRAKLLKLYSITAATTVLVVGVLTGHPIIGLGLPLLLIAPMILFTLSS